MIPTWITKCRLVLNTNILQKTGVLFLSLWQQPRYRIIISLHHTLQNIFTPRVGQLGICSDPDRDNEDAEHGMERCLLLIAVQKVMTQPTRFISTPRRATYCLIYICCHSYAAVLQFYKHLGKCI